MTCGLNVYPLSECPPYAALSYTWSNEPVDQPIHVNGNEIDVTASCRDAIQIFRDEWSSALVFPTYSAASSRLWTLRGNGIHNLWVDQLCIDQHDDAERAQQILLMREIYAAAACVWVFISPKELLVANLEGHVIPRAYSRSANVPPLQERTLTLIETLLQAGDDVLEENAEIWTKEQDEGAWIGLLNMLKARYWTRRFILQEISVNYDTFLYYDGRLIDLWTLGYVDKMLNQSLFNMRRTYRWRTSVSLALAFSRRSYSGGALFASQQLRTMEPDLGVNVMLFALIASGRLKTELPEDIIFSLQSFADTASGLPQPVYKTPLLQLCLTYASKFMELGFTSQILQLGGTAWHKSAMLPSWCPEFTNTGHYQSMTAFFLRNASLPNTTLMNASSLPSYTLSREGVPALSLRAHLACSVTDCHSIESKSNAMSGSIAFVSGHRSRLKNRVCKSVKTLARDLLNGSAPERIHIWADTFANTVQGVKIALQLLYEYCTSGGFSNIDLSYTWDYLQMGHFRRTHKLAVTSAGLLGLVPLTTWATDHVALVPGCWLPLIIRGKSPGKYEVIGDAFFLDLNGCFPFEEEGEEWVEVWGKPLAQTRLLFDRYRERRDVDPRKVCTPDLQPEDLMEVVIE